MLFHHLRGICLHWRDRVGSKSVVQVRRYGVRIVSTHIEAIVLILPKVDNLQLCIVCSSIKKDSKFTDRYTCNQDMIWVKFAII